jgi:hypothetical protein
MKDINQMSTHQLIEEISNQSYRNKAIARRLLMDFKSNWSYDELQEIREGYRKLSFLQRQISSELRRENFYLRQKIKSITTPEDKP